MELTVKQWGLEFRENKVGGFDLLTKSGDWQAVSDFVIKEESNDNYEIYLLNDKKISFTMIANLFEEVEIKLGGDEVKRNKSSDVNTDVYWYELNELIDDVKANTKIYNVKGRFLVYIKSKYMKGFSDEEKAKVYANDVAYRLAKGERLSDVKKDKQRRDMYS